MLVESKLYLNGELSDHACCALLGLAVGVQKFPANIDPAELVRCHGLCAVAFNELNRTIAGMYLSEGVFNGVATALMVDSLGGVVDYMKSSFIKMHPSLLSVGEVGEIVSRIMVLVAARHAPATSSNSRDKPSIRSLCEFVFEPVAIESFLDTLCGKRARQAYLKQNPGVQGACVSFNHFTCMMKEVCKPYDVMAACLMRGAGCVAKSGSRGVDYMIPLVLGDGRLSFIYVQVKTGPSYRHSLGRALVQDSSPQLAFRNSFDPEIPYIYVIHHVHDYGDPSAMDDPLRHTLVPYKDIEKDRLAELMSPEKSARRASSKQALREAEGEERTCLVLRGVYLGFSADLWRDQGVPSWRYPPHAVQRQGQLCDAGLGVSALHEETRRGRASAKRPRHHQRVCRGTGQSLPCLARVHQKNKTQACPEAIDQPGSGGTAQHTGGGGEVGPPEAKAEPARGEQQAAEAVMACNVN